MTAFCPYCKTKMKEVTREENLDVIYTPNIEIVFQCPHCKKEPLLKLEPEGWYDEDDNPIEEIA